MLAFGAVVVIATASSVTAVLAGNCGPVGEGPLADLAAIVDAAVAADLETGRVQARTRRLVETPAFAPCISPLHSHRDYVEHKELEQIEEQVKKQVDDICSKNVCASNVGYALLAWNPWVPVFGGCSNWALAASDAIGAPTYFDKRREQRCAAPGVCHFVIVLTNPRTAEEHVVDAWSHAGGWGSKGDRKRSLFTTWSRFKRDFPYESHSDNNATGRCTRNER